MDRHRHIPLLDGQSAQGDDLNRIPGMSDRSCGVVDFEGRGHHIRPGPVRRDAKAEVTFVWLEARVVPRNMDGDVLLLNTGGDLVLLEELDRKAGI